MSDTDTTPEEDTAPNSTDSDNSGADYEYRRIEDLKHHPANSEIYTDRTEDIETLVMNMMTRGFDRGNPLTIRPDGAATKGNRRLAAAKSVGIERVPVVVKEYDSYSDELHDLISDNRAQGERSDRDKWREVQVLASEIEDEAKERQRVEGNQYTGQDEGVETFPQAQSNKSRDELGEKIGMSGRSYSKLDKVMKMAGEEVDIPGVEVESVAVSDDVREVAQKQVAEIDTGEQSISAAYTEVRNAVEAEEREQAQASVAESVEADVDGAASIDVSPGDVWALGDHVLYCGDTGEDSFKSLVREQSGDGVAFAFADPPYATGAAEWDDDESEVFDWQHDWLHDVSDIVAVTPGIVSIFDFAERTVMPYRWSVAAWIKNGMTRGDLGFGNWIYVALFADGETSLHRESQDVARVTVNTSETGDTDHKGRKPSGLMMWLLERFTDEGETVVDPFAGSGSTLFAAEEMDRVCITGEREPEFCAEIIARWNESHPENEASQVGDA